MALNDQSLVSMLQMFPSDDIAYGTDVFTGEMFQSTTTQEHWESNESDYSNPPSACHSADEESSSDHESSQSDDEHPLYPEDKKELLDLLGWKEGSFGDQKKRKRECTTKESQMAKHKNAEKNRRTEMNGVLEHIKSMLPGDNKGKMTKLHILNASAEYLARMQTLCVQLLDENKKMKTQLCKS
eukprot:TRINITY_DN11268_c0_g1_i1.p1 TRINITY_DN11268_c0_g1~~TRINITY_DN11268_c0_g1_i1.p1  ORF type:complete len:184 (+),score=34.89 TRINITY_DN11268_c0_g1_i1:88-639(+)